MIASMTSAWGSARVAPAARGGGGAGPLALRSRSPVPLRSSGPGAPRARGRGSLRVVAGSGKVYTIVGPGGAGKTTAAIALAKALTAQGINTVLAISSDDRVAEDLLGCEIPAGGSMLEGSGALVPPAQPDGLQVCRVQPLALLEDMFGVFKKGDERFALSSGAINSLSAKELTMIPGLESYLMLACLRRTAAAADAVVYDGPSSADVLRMMGAPGRMSWYIRKASGILKKSDVGRVVAPSLQDLLAWIITQEPGYNGDPVEGDAFEAVSRMLDGGGDVFSLPENGATLVVADGTNEHSIRSARRLQGIAMQQGAIVGGAIVMGGAGGGDSFPGLPTIEMPAFAGSWDPLVGAVPGDMVAKAAGGDLPRAVTIDQGAGEVKIYLPGFAKGEVKLSQPKGGDELLVDAGGQRKHIQFPAGFQGKVKGAKFADETLTVTIA